VSHLQERLDAARVVAHNGGIPIRRKDGTLYRLLADCLSICEMVEAEGLEAELRAAIRVPASAGNRDKKYAEVGSDAPILVCRYVLRDDVRNSAYRYSACLREARKRQIRSEDLAAWLDQNGGLNTLWMSRPLTEARLTRRTLHLNDAVTVPKRGHFTLTLEADARGFFNVITPPEAQP
jgi:hypothetical protein